MEHPDFCITSRFSRSDHQTIARSSRVPTKQLLYTKNFVPICGIFYPLPVKLCVWYFDEEMGRWNQLMKFLATVFEIYPGLRPSNLFLYIHILDIFLMDVVYIHSQSQFSKIKPLD